MNLKVVLNSPSLLQQFWYDRPTVVYTDACIGTAKLPGGLGVMIVQNDGESDYVCVYASAGLTPASKELPHCSVGAPGVLFACGKFYDWLAGIPFVWRSDCRAHEFLHTAKTSTNPTITRDAMILAEFNFRVEWIPWLTMIADSFSRLVLSPIASESEAISLPEIVFGVELGKRIGANKRHEAAAAPLLLYVPVSELVIEAPCVVEVAVEDKFEVWRPVEVTGRVEVPVAITTPPRDLDVTVLFNIPMYSCDEIQVESSEGVRVQPSLEELGVWPKLTLREALRLRALPWLRRWVLEARVPVHATGTPDGPSDASDSASAPAIPAEVIPALSDMGKKVWIDDGKLWKLTRRGL